MVQKENLNKLESDRRKNYIEEEESEQARRHAEIIKALTVRRKPAPKKVEAKKAFRMPTLPGRKPGPVPTKPGAPTAPKPAEPVTPTVPKPSAPAPSTASQEAARKAREEAVRKSQEEAARKTQEETARKAREAAEAARKAREAREAAEAAKKAKDAEEAAKKAREAAEAAKKAKDAEEAAKKAKEAEESAKKAREAAEAAKKTREAEEAAKKAREEATRKAQEESARKAREEADRKTREEATRKAREEADRKTREEAARKSAERVERKPDQPRPAQPARPAGPSASRVPRRTLEDAKKSGVAVVGAISAIGVTNVYAQKAILQTSAKESLIDVASNESGAQEYLNTLNKRGYGYIQQTFPQLKPGGALAKKLGYAKEGVPESLVRKSLESGNETWYDMAYNYPGNTLGNTEPGDGWKYRGRGLVAITGKSNYAKTSETLAKMGINVDLVNNPDRLREPDIAYKAAVAYYINTLAKGDVKKGLEKLNSYKTQDEALREIIHATAGMGHKIASIERGFGNNKIDEKGVATGSHLFVNYERAKGYSSLADQIISMSSENSQMRQQSAAPAGPGTTNNFNLPRPAATGQQNRPVVDDRSPYSRKSTQ
jgi:hypothetical protein